MMSDSVGALILLGAAAPSFTKRTDFSHGQDNAFSDGLIAGVMQNRPKTIYEFGKLLFRNPESPDH